VSWSSILAYIALITVGGIVPASAQETTTPASQAVGQYSDLSANIVIRHQVDKTALYAGDRVRYYLEIKTAPNMDILVDDLDASNLELTGLEVVSFAQTKSSSDNGMTYQAQYVLTAYDVTRSSLLIGNHTIRYFVQQPGMRTGGATPAGEIIVPATPLVLRSTLPASLSQLRIRDEHFRDMVPGGMTWTGTAGLILILISGAPVALSVISLVRQQIAIVRRRRVPKASSTKKITVLEKLEAVNANASSERRDGYDLLEVTIRNYLAETGDIHANCLTATEFSRRLQDIVSRISVEEVVSVLEDCERARYGRFEQLPSAERFEAGVTTVRRLLLGH